MDKQTFIEWVRKLLPTYKAHPSVLAQLSAVDLVAIVGPTGVGKTTIIEKLDVPSVMSDVSREPRAGERNGHEYHFRTDYLEMLQEIKAGQYVQFVVGRNGEFYGTRASCYPKEGPAAMAVIASALSSFRKLGFRSVLPIYVLPPGYAEWMHRIGSNRVLDFEARMSEARESLPLALADSEYNFVLNDDLELAVKEVGTIIAGGAMSEHRSELARSSADLLFGRLGLDDTSLLSL